MKTSLINLRIVLFFLITVFAVTLSHGQNSKKDKNAEKAERVHNLVNNTRDFIFIAQTVIPMGGRTINLTSPYDIRLTKDTLVSDLPYFGRAFVAPMNPSEGGFRFTLTNFNYNVEERKKGGWQITITPKDTRDIRQMSLSISQDGYASLQVMSNNRQSISYNDFIRERTSRERV